LLIYPLTCVRPQHYYPTILPFFDPSKANGPSNAEPPYPIPVSMAAYSHLRRESRSRLLLFAAIGRIRTNRPPKEARSECVDQCGHHLHVHDTMNAHSLRTNCSPGDTQCTYDPPLSWASSLICTEYPRTLNSVHYTLFPFQLCLIHSLPAYAHLILS
jgi:hypothetical protein